MNEAERLLAIHLAALPVHVEEQYRYVPGRRFKADFALPDHKLLIEVVGGVWTGQAHGSVSGVLKDIERTNLAALYGWRMLRFTPDQVGSGEALATVTQTLAPALGLHGTKRIPDRRYEDQPPVVT